MSGKLYVVGTPIGNLGDWSPRAQKVMRDCDFIAAEDTRVTKKLLHFFEISKPLVSYYAHNERESAQRILARLLAGESGVLVSDAGMPAISDPGELLVRLCHEEGIAVESVPGPVAFATALSVSGMPSGRFTFEGFLSVAKSPRREHLAQLANETRTMLFYEAPHKLLGTLQDFLKTFGAQREIAVVRELTKMHEEVRRGTLAQMLEHYTQHAPKGEFVLIVAGKAVVPAEKPPMETAVELARARLQAGDSASDAAKFAAKQTGHKKGDIYKLLQN